MTSAYLSLILDIFVLISLGITIFFVFKLSNALSGFKQYRREFDNVITNLLSSIDQAERSIQNLKTVSAQEADHLEKLISQSRALSEELKIINDAGESMATRLEQLAEKNRKVAQGQRGESYSGSPANKKPNPRSAEISSDEKKISSPVPRKASETKKDMYAQTLRNMPAPKNDDKEMQESDMPSFMIRDSEHERENYSNDDSFDVDEPGSQAEKELLEAIRKSKKNILGGR